MTERDSRSKPPGEPSVDEILESIRRIVFENDGERPVRGAGVPESETPEPETPAAEIPAADSPAGSAGRAAPDTTARPAAPDVPPGEPPDAGHAVAGEDRAVAQTGPPEGTALQEPRTPAPDGSQESGDPAGQLPGDAGDIGAGNDDTVLLLTEMIAPDGSIVRLGPGSAEAPAPQDAAVAARTGEGTGEGTGDGGGEGAGETALDPATQGDLAAAVREWMDRNAPDLVDRAARRELQKLADRQE